MSCFETTETPTIYVSKHLKHPTFSLRKTSKKIVLVLLIYVNRDIVMCK